MSGIRDSFTLEGKRALVTGAGRGIGREIAVAFAQLGAQVALVSRSGTELEETRRLIEADGGRAVQLPYDLLELGTGAELIDLAEDGLGAPVDNIVHSAGLQHRAPAAEFPPSQWDRLLRVNLTVPFLLSQELGRRQLDAGREGNHIFIASLASVMGLGDTVAYNASKSGVMGLVRSLSTEWSARGIRANAIAPGYIETAMTADLMADPVKRAARFAQIPMRRFGRPDDIVGAAVFLAAPLSSYVTGQLLFVDGGTSTI
ncbi:SDR family NAD(P)-dependent oxidoreductase [Gryllotalpicola reticulitermitis]|uniref:SDR family NAD(P)-dependent oxidoreductase n=1 Tax=Gryllotalpicola reticulitermitis TaxID=1184153 RepID=A0ABV8Q584_9MICO